MANTNAPRGFEPYNAIFGGTPSFVTLQYPILYSNGTKIFRNDPVQLSSGYVIQAVANTTQILGVFQGCHYYSVSARMPMYSQFWPGGDVATGATVICDVIVDPDAQFAVQSDGAAITFANVGSNATFTIGTGDTLSGYSGAALTQSTIATTNTFPFKITGLLDTPPGAPGTAASSYNYALVKLNYSIMETQLGV